MRFWLRAFLLLLLFLGGVVAGMLWFAHREMLARQWACYRVGAAESFPRAQEKIAWFEEGSNRQARLDELVRTWGTGNRQFDLYLGGHLRDAACSELLRETFANELDRREEMLPRWADYWSYQSPLKPDEQIASVLKYLDTLASAEPPKEITYREVLDLKAVLQLLGQGAHAANLSPANWQEPYRRWQQTRPAELPHVVRPGKPFADWTGPENQRGKASDRREGSGQ